MNKVHIYTKIVIIFIITILSLITLLLLNDIFFEYFGNDNNQIKTLENNFMTHQQEYEKYLKPETETFSNKSEYMEKIKEWEKNCIFKKNKSYSGQKIRKLLLKSQKQYIFTNSDSNNEIIDYSSKYPNNYLKPKIKKLPNSNTLYYLPFNFYNGLLINKSFFTDHNDKNNIIENSFFLTPTKYYKFNNYYHITPPPVYNKS